MLKILSVFVRMSLKLHTMDKFKFSLFTAAIWQKNLQTFIIASNSLDHTKKLLESILSNTLEIHIFSDNATSQFKNKVVISTMMHLEIKFNNRVFWHFFAAVHGKGVVDGIGATVKRLASNKIKSGKIEIQSANDFVNSLQNVLYVSEEENSAHNCPLNLSQIIQQAKIVKDIS